MNKLMLMLLVLSGCESSVKEKSSDLNKYVQAHEKLLKFRDMVKNSDMKTEPDESDISNEGGMRFHWYDCQFNAEGKPSPVAGSLTLKTFDNKMVEFSFVNSGGDRYYYNTLASVTYIIRNVNHDPKFFNSILNRTKCLEPR